MSADDPRVDILAEARRVAADLRSIRDSWDPGADDTAGLTLMGVGAIALEDIVQDAEHVIRDLLTHLSATHPAPEHAALADGTVLRDRTARDLGITNRSDEARWAPSPDPDDLLARLDCGCDPDQGHHICQPGDES